MLAKTDHITQIKPQKKNRAIADKALWASFKKGNELSFSIIYKVHRQNLYTYGIHFCRDHEIVIDSLQELFTRLWSTRQNLAEVSSIKFYLFTSFRRLLLSHLAQKRKFSSINSSEQFDLSPSLEDQLLSNESKFQETQRLRKAIDELTVRQKEVIFLKFHNGLSYQEISELMGMQVDSVYNLVSKTVQLLRKKLDAAFVLILASLSLLFI